METTIPAPSFLPLSVRVSVPAKNLIMKKIVLKPTDNAKDVKVLIQKVIDRLAIYIYIHTNPDLLSSWFYLYLYLEI